MLGDQAVDVVGATTWRRAGDQGNGLASIVVVGRLLGWLGSRSRGGRRRRRGRLSSLRRLSRFGGLGRRTGLRLGSGGGRGRGRRGRLGGIGRLRGRGGWRWRRRRAGGECQQDDHGACDDVSGRAHGKPPCTVSGAVNTRSGAAWSGFPPDNASTISSVVVRVQACCKLGSTGWLGL